MVVGWRLRRRSQGLSRGALASAIPVTAGETTQGRRRERTEEPDPWLCCAPVVPATRAVRRLAAPYTLCRDICLLAEEVATDTVDGLREHGVARPWRGISP